MCEAFPNRRHELDLYEREIVNMASRYPGAGFYDYHKQFSAKAASYLKNHNWKLDWSKRDSQLYSNIFTNYKSNCCQHCYSVSHLSDFCPRILQENKSTFYGPVSNNYSNKRSGSSDSYSRQKYYMKGEEICNNFNGNKGCFRNRCNNLHVCIGCHGPHPRSQCTNVQGQYIKNSLTAKKRSSPPQHPESEKVKVPHISTPIDSSILHKYLQSHPDKNFTNYLLNGLKQGFHTGIQELPSTTLECKNLLSASSQPEVTTQLIQSEVEKGFLIGPLDKMPFSIYRTNPIGVAEGKYSQKKRLIVDMSAPHNDENNTCLNDMIVKEDFSLNYVTVDDAIARIKEKGKGSWLCKTDIKDAFKLIPIHPSLWPFHGIKWQGKYYYYTRLVFGSRSSPKIFDTLSVAVCWIATNVFGISTILHLLDDFLTIDPPDILADRTMALITLLFKKLQIPIAPNKTVGPTTCLEYLGIILDTEAMEARLPLVKVQRIQGILLEFSVKKSCTKRELLSLLGHLNFAS